MFDLILAAVIATADPEPTPAPAPVAVLTMPPQTLPLQCNPGLVMHGPIDGIYWCSAPYTSDDIGVTVMPAPADDAPAAVSTAVSVAAPPVPTVVATHAAPRVVHAAPVAPVPVFVPTPGPIFTGMFGK